jgi:dsDNA-specific endonuclease/ATPase MutS2
MSDLEDEYPPDAVRLPLEDAIDLHTFAPRDVPDVVATYLEEAARAGLREVRVIHGKGAGMQKAVVRRVLEASPLVERFTDAPAERGGWGATIVFLRR